MRRLVIVVFALLLSSRGVAQECSVTVLASFYDQLTKNEIETLKTQDIEVKIDGKKMPVLSASRNFNNRLLILLETEGSAKNDKLADLVSTVTQQARQAPAGKPVAFGVFAEKATFTKGFSSEPEMRTAAVNEVIESAPPLGKRVALWDALHEALALFGPHQPGDTILLIGDPYDDASHRSPESVEKEFIVNGTRLFMMRRTQGSRVERDFLWQSHDLEKMESAIPRQCGADAQEDELLLSCPVPCLRTCGHAVQKRKHPKGRLLKTKLRLSCYFFFSSPPCSAGAADCSSSICLRTSSWRLVRISARLARLASITFSLPSNSM